MDRPTFATLLICLSLSVLHVRAQAPASKAEPFALLISKKGKIVSETYAPGRHANSLCNVQSLTKSLMATLIGIAIDQQIIESDSQPIGLYLSELYDFPKNSTKKDITLAQLMNQTSGLGWKGHLEHQAWLDSDDPIAYILDKDLEHSPGTTYNYNSGATHLLSVILSQVSGMSTLAFADKYLFIPLGFGEVQWQKRNDGYFDGSGLGLAMLPKDLMSWAQMLEDKGTFKGQRILSESWIHRMFEPELKNPTEWGLPNSMHGYCWYKAMFKGESINYGMGYGGQFIIMVPEKELIIVSTHEHDTSRGIPQQMRFLHGRLPILLDKYSN